MYGALVPAATPPQPAISPRDVARLEILSTGGYAEVPAQLMQGLDTRPQLAQTRANLAQCPQQNLDFAVSAAREAATSVPSDSQE